MDPIPQEYICPITAEIMTDPVIGTDGHTYERSAITEWLTTQHPHSPMTRVPMTVGDLKPNFALLWRYPHFTKLRCHRGTLYHQPWKLFCQCVSSVLHINRLPLRLTWKREL